MKKRFQYSLLALLISTLACEPMLAIGRNEFLILVIIVLALLGPPIYRFIRRVEDFLKHEKKDKQ